ncbi:hypothetical protein KIH77_01010 [Bifidobacterium sp. 82T24]|uniref:DUF6725 family protein n=1 Tax=Bifidobacterium pluvialisilvae TaxID=2834436 RepID=UPI001C58B7F3|nr:DUF6725 family protein [Bifidobacterium pluvialisilvae]MBW3087326.1 hypothetical protein [Bifidobacterium pluvialisilvae]
MSIEQRSAGIARIPIGARIVVRTSLGPDPLDGRERYRDFVGHVTGHDDATLHLLRDESANGRRPAQLVDIRISDIVRFKPVPERLF